MTLDAMLTPPEPESARTVVPSKPRRHRHEWADDGTCRRCPAIHDPAASRRGRNNRTRGNRHELAVARTYGGEKVGPLGGPEDVRGRMFRLQLKTHQSEPPVRWKAIFAALDTQHDGRVPVLLLRYLGPGRPAEDFFIVRGPDWLALHGKDEEER